MHIHESDTSRGPGAVMESPYSHSTAHAPDLDWSQVRETVLMLALAVAQIENGIKDGDDSVGALARLFTTIMGNASAIHEAAKQLPDSEFKAAITLNFWEISEKMQTAIIAFQFYDKLVQRLGHVTFSLTSLSDLINDAARLFSPEAWRKLQLMIHEKCSISEDRQVLKALINGTPLKEAIQIFANDTARDPLGDIELF